MDSKKPSRDFPGEYRLDVEDFGPIAKASVDVRPLTVFIGPSNTGKSYLALLLYALHQCFLEEGVGPFGSRVRYGNQMLGTIYSTLQESGQGVNEMLDSFQCWLQKSAGDYSQVDTTRALGADVGPGSKLSKTWNRHDFPHDVESFIHSTLARAEGLSDYADHEISRCFGVAGLGTLVRRASSSSPARVEIRVSRSHGDRTVRYGLEIGKEDVGFFGEIGGSQSLSREIENANEIDQGSLNLKDLNPRSKAHVEYLRYSLSKVADDIFKSLLRPLYRNAYYLPAGRTGFMQSHLVVLSTLVQNASTAGIRASANIPMLSGVLGDFLSQLIGMGGEQLRVRSSVRHGSAEISGGLANRLERDVLRGDVRMELTEAGPPSLEYRPDGWSERLPLMQASSMVSELAPVVLYLRYLVRPDDVLIIEEPESHLHPAMQVEFTRQLAGLARAGIRVIVTTHSEWVLQELANLVRASGLSEADRAGIAGGDVALDPDQVGAWLFKPDATGEGSTVNEIPLDGESGLYPTDFEDVAVAMHNDWAEIFSRVGEDE